MLIQIDIRILENALIHKSQDVVIFMFNIQMRIIPLYTHSIFPANSLSESTFTTHKCTAKSSSSYIEMGRNYAKENNPPVVFYRECLVILEVPLRK